jgi:dUTP pyrophosphatase
MNIKLTHPNAKVPTRSHEHDAGWDLYVAEIFTSPNPKQKAYDFGVAFDIPTGNVGLVFMRSSGGTRMDLSLSNAVGVIDSTYQGSVKAVFDILTRNVVVKENYMEEEEVTISRKIQSERYYNVGDRAAQIVFIPLTSVTEMTVVKDFTNKTDRNERGFGSTGK